MFDEGKGRYEVAAEGEIPDGRISAAAGDMAFRCVRRAVELVQSGRARVIVTAPLNKAALHDAGHHYDGHTGMLASLTGAPSSFMLLASERLSTLHVSTHVSLREAIERVTPERISATVEAGHAHLAKLGKARPRIAVAGLNPHCGEGGIFGDEDARRIAPAVAGLAERGFDVSGPISADRVFYRAAITILVPVLLPVAVAAGVDPVHFGVIMVLNLMIGLLTPPVGMVLYVLSRVSHISFEKCMRGTLPFLVPLVIALLLVTFIPAISMWLPTVIYR